MIIRVCTSWIWCMIVGVSIGCDGGAADARSTTRSVNILALPWIVEIARDGAGGVTYGSGGGGDSEHLPKGTFDFADIHKKLMSGSLKAASNDPKDRIFSMTLRDEDGSTATFYTRDVALIRSVVKHGVNAANTQRMRDLWTQSPLE